MLELRREALEQWLQCLAKVEPTPVELLEFLDLPLAEKHEDVSETRVLGFNKDPYRNVEMKNDDDTDMITQITLDSFYAK